MIDSIKCPECGSRTRLRTSRKDGSKFHVCINYPRCKGRVVVDEVVGDDWGVEESVLKATHDRSRVPLKNSPRGKMKWLTVKGVVAIIAICVLIGGTAAAMTYYYFPNPDVMVDATPSATSESDGGGEQAGTLTYEVVSTYTLQIITGYRPGPPGGTGPDIYNEACVEIRNTGTIAGLFSVDFSYPEIYSGHDLIYLTPGETGVASYLPCQTFDDHQERGIQAFENDTVMWDYEVSPVVSN